jgi:hypothetical protein
MPLPCRPDFRVQEAGYLGKVPLNQPFMTTLCERFGTACCGIYNLTVMRDLFFLTRRKTVDLIRPD